MSRSTKIPECRESAVLLAVCLLAASSLIHPPSLWAESAAVDCVEYDEFTNWVGRASLPFADRRCVANGDHLFVLEESALRSFDITNPSDPVELGVVATSTSVLGLSVFGGRAFVYGAGSSVGVFDISTPTQMVRLGSFGLSDDVRDVVTYDSDAFIVTDTGLQIWDSPENPGGASLIGFNDTFSGRQIAVINDFAIIAWEFGMLVVDVVSRTSPVLVSELEFGSTNAMMTIGDDVAAVADSSTVFLIDISSRRFPVQESTLPNFDEIRGISLDGHELAIADARYISLFNVSDPADPVLTRRLDVSFAADVDFSRPHAYVVSALRGLDVADFSTPMLAPDALLSTQSPLSDVVCAESFAVAIDRASGLRIADLVSPASWVGELAFGAPIDLYHHGATVGYAFTSANVTVVDLADITKPTAIRSIPGYNDAIQALTYERTLYVLHGDNQLVTFDLSDPTNPLFLTENSFSGPGRGLARVGPNLFVLHKFGSNYEISVLDIEHGGNPTLVKSVAVPRASVGVCAIGDMLITADNIGNLHVLDASDPSALHPVSSASTPWPISRISTASNLVYASSAYGVHVHKLTNTFELRLLGTLVSDSELFGVSPDEGRVCIATEDGLVIAPAQCGPKTPIDSWELPAFETSVFVTIVHPNPATGTGFALSFNLPAADGVDLELYDVGGRRTLATSLGRYSAGPHTVRPDLARVSGGMYLLRLRSESGATSTQKVLITR